MINIKIIKRLIEKTVREAEEEAVFAGVDINTPEFEQVIFTLKKKLLERLGVDFDEYRNIVKNLSETSKEKADEKRTVEVKRIENELRKYLEKELKNIEERQAVSEDKIRKIALDVAKDYVKPPQIINQIVKEIEKPTIIEKNFTIKEKEEYNDKPLRKEIKTLEKKIDKIKPIEFDPDSLKEDLKGYFNEQLEKNINILGMPDFRKLAMGLDSRITSLEQNSAIDGVSWSEITGTQSVINLSGFTNDAGFITGLDWGQLGATANQQRVDDNASIGMADGATTLRFRSGGYDDKNYIEVYGGDNASLVNPSFRSEGAGTNVGIDFHTKGRQYFQFRGTRDSAAEIRIFENSLLGNDYVGLTVAEDTASYTLQLPDTAPSDQFIIYDASGIGTWQTYVAPTVDGSGTTNEITYWVDPNTLGALSTATYPSLTELSYVKGVTSSIQTQLNNKQPLDTQLTDLAGLSYTGNSLKVVRVNAGETGWELATPSGGGDMVLADVQSVTGLKTFDKDKLAMKGTSTGVTTISTANTGASNYTATLQAATGTIAYTSDITGTNSGTNTGDQNIFQTIAVSGQSNVVADTTTDTLTLVAGTNITITTDAGTDSITINSTASGGGLTWNEVTGTTQTASVDNGYITNNASQVVVTLPTTAAVGKTVRIGGKGAGGWRVAQNASEIIHFGNVDTTTGTGGYIESTNRYDAVELLCIVADTEWVVLSSQGNLTIV